jgi:catechol 2,3-dioxygenase-like lactoylglutathione lyase family enzyme
MPPRSDKWNAFTGTLIPAKGDTMSGRLRHLAIVSDRPPLLSEFYRTLFGMNGEPPKPGGAAVFSDGYIGFNVNPRAPGRQGGFDHFGFEVDAVDDVRAELSESYPTIQLAQRPGGRPFAGISTHDPVGNVFDLSQRDMANRRDVYVDDIRDQPRYVDHVVLRVVETDRIARYYMDLFDLQEMEKAPSDRNTYLTDGRVTFVIAPWDIHDYDGGGIERPALEHIGFKVDSVDAVLSDLEAMMRDNPELSPKPWKEGPEGAVRLRKLAECPRGQYQLCDPDGVLIDLTEA